MEIHWSILFVLETVGTIAFASSGAMIAIERNLDLLGIIVLGVITAVGGDDTRSYHRKYSACSFQEPYICVDGSYYRTDSFYSYPFPSVHSKRCLSE